MRRLIWRLTGRMMGIMGLIVISGVESCLWCVPVGCALVTGSITMIWIEEL